MDFLYYLLELSEPHLVAHRCGPLQMSMASILSFSIVGLVPVFWNVMRVHFLLFYFLYFQSISVIICSLLIYSESRKSLTLFWAYLVFMFLIYFKSLSNSPKILYLISKTHFESPIRNLPPIPESLAVSFTAVVSS